MIENKLIKRPFWQKIIVIVATVSLLLSVMIVPSFAEDLDENVNNLLGTTWIIDSWETLPAMGSYDVKGRWSFNPYFTSSEVHSFSNISLGFLEPPLDYDEETETWVPDPQAPKADYVWFESPGLNYANGFAFTAGMNVNITFTGGTDLSNPLLIQFIVSNGRRVSAFPSPSPDPDPDPDPDYYISAGWYYSSLETPVLQRGIDFDLSFNTMGRSFTYIVCNGAHLGFDSLLVCDSGGWTDYGYRLIFVTEPATLEPSDWEFFTTVYTPTITGSQASYEQGFRDGNNAGYGRGFSDGLSEGESLGYDVGFDEGYRVGYEVGYADNTGGSGGDDSSSFGDNLLGDTLAVPFEALNNFTLYETTSGFEITLGGVIGASICLTLFLGFLKIFAGG